ncbi:MAG: 3TM-type holin [Bdellovibrionales bacterium]
MKDGLRRLWRPMFWVAAVLLFLLAYSLFRPHLFKWIEPRLHALTEKIDRH